MRGRRGPVASDANILTLPTGDLLLEPHNTGYDKGENESSSPGGRGRGGAIGTLRGCTWTNCEMMLHRNGERTRASVRKRAGDKVRRTGLLDTGPESTLGGEKRRAAGAKQ